MLQDVHSFLKTLLSESNKQQQDLYAIRDDLGSLKFGFAFLQNANSKLTTDSKRQNLEIKRLKKVLETQDDKIDDIGTWLENHKTMTTIDLSNLQIAVQTVQTTLDDQGMEIAGLDICLEDHKANTLANFTTLLSAIGTAQTTLAGLEICLEDHKTDTSSQLDAVETLQHPCGGPGWTQVVNFDMAIASTECPAGWELGEHSKRSCGRTNDGAQTCSIANFMFEEGPQQFSKICGRVKAYALRAPDAFESSTTETTIDSAYVSGVALTTGVSPNIEHICCWDC